MISTGLMTMRALDAAKRLEADNVDAALDECCEVFTPTDP